MTQEQTEATREWGGVEVATTLREILVDSLGVQDAEVTATASLVRDLGAESIDFLDIGFKIQQTFGVNLRTADIRSRIMAWAGLLLPALSEILQERYGVSVTPDELRPLEKDGLAGILEYVQAIKGVSAGPGAAEGLGRRLVDRLVREFSALGFAVSPADQEDLVGILRTNLTARRLVDRTLDLLTVGALTDFICTKLGARLRV
jgi:acyl carrier protein